MGVTRKIRWAAVIVLCLGMTAKAMACTSVIVSGRATKDGRPLLFKNRDTGRTDNVAVLVQGEKYRYIGIVSALDMEPQDVWGGHNEVGFAIINTAAYNLNGCEGKDSNHDGELMRRALEICRTLADFELLLDTLPKPMDLNSNFGVMDAEGGCAYYETGNFGFVKFDANDPAVAPDGYLMRTNHGTTGCRDIDMGVERYMAISDFMGALQGDRIDAQSLVTGIPRYLTHGLTKINLYDLLPQDENDTRMFAFRDFIPRWSTSSAILVQGIRQGELPLLTVSWTNIGWPLASVCIPLMMTSEGKLPAIVGHGEGGSSWLCRQAMAWKQRVFSAPSGNVHDYIDIARLINRARTGIAQQVVPLEQEVLRRGSAVVEQLRQGKAPSRAVADYYQWVDSYVVAHYPQAP